jgi:hypothetical protein
VERLAKIAVLASALAALAAYLWLAALHAPVLLVAASGAFLVSLLLSIASLGTGLALALGTAYLAPGMLLAVSGSAEYHLLLVWLALLAGPVCAGSDWTRWHLPPAWKLPVAAWALVVAATWPVVAGREIDFSAVAARTLDTVNGPMAGAPPVVAAWVINTALAQMLALLALDLLWARYGTRLQHASRIVLLPLAISIAASGAAAVYQELGDRHWLSAREWPLLDRATGLMVDANSLGTAAAIWAPLVLLLGYRSWSRVVVAPLVAALLVGAVLASGSRTALLVLAASSLGVAAVVVRRARQRGSIAARFALPIGAAALLVGVLLSAGDPSSAVARLASTTAPSPAPRDLLMQLFWVRNGYGSAAVEAIGEHPWTGVGIGSFGPLSSYYSLLAIGGPLPPDNAQNWWRHQIAELGVVGAAPSLIFSLLLLAALIRRRAPEQTRDHATITRAVLAGIGLASLFGVLTQHPALFLTFVVVAYWFGAAAGMVPAREARHDPRHERSESRRAWIAVLLVTAVVAGGQIAAAHGDLRVPRRALRVGFPFAYGFSAAAPDPVLGQARWAAARAVAVLPVENRWFALTLAGPSTGPSPAVSVQILRGTDTAASIDALGAEPVTRLLAVPDAARFLMIELRTSHAADEARAIRVAGRWLAAPPEETPPAAIVP